MNLSDRGLGHSRPPDILAEPWSWGRWLRNALDQAEDPGYFGPSSATWLIHREAVLGLGLGQTIFMQLAHPWVAQGVLDHSTFRQDPLDRLAATVAAAELITFGSRRQAEETTSHIRSIHTRINGSLSRDIGRWRQGTYYSAEDPDALLWVQVTLMDTAITVYEAAFGKLPDDVVRAYCSEGKILATLLAGDPERVPADREELASYIRYMIDSETVAVGPIARALVGDLLKPSLPLSLRLLSTPYRRAARATAAAFMPPEIVLQYGPVLAPLSPRLYAAAGRLGTAVLRRLPRSVRDDPIAARAIAARIARAPSPPSG